MYRYTLADHKTGHQLLGSLARIITRVSGDNILHKIYYRFNCVTNRNDKWVCIIRHPYEIIASGYNYHKVCDEWWAVNPGTNLYEYSVVDARRLCPDANFSDEGTYQENLNSMFVEDGIKYEMGNIAKLTIEAMYYWNYYNMPNVLTIKFEDFRIDFNGTVKRIVDFFVIDSRFHDEIIANAQTLNLSKKPSSEVLVNKHVTNKKLEEYFYKNIFLESHYNLAKEIYPKDLLERFGYSE